MRRGGLVLAVVAVVTLTGCATLKAGSAATVGDNALAEATVADIVAEIQTVVSDAELEQTLPADQVNQSIVALWVDEEITEALAASEDVSVSDGEVDRFLQQFDEQARVNIASEAAIPPSQLERAARNVLLRNKLGQTLAPGADQEAQSQALAAALVETADELGVSVNPRFGSWNASVPGVEARSPDRLSQPADAGPDQTPDPLAPATP